MSEIFWLKCKKCGQRWSKLTSDGLCLCCDPDYLMPKAAAPREKKEQPFSEKMKKGNPDYFQS